MSNSQTTADRHGRVFVVDDDRGIRDAFLRLLRAAGFDAQAFGSSQEFLACHDHTVPGCVLLDIRMDDMDGLALQEFLSRGRYARPIIFITGCDDARTSVKAFKAGAEDYLIKPVDEHDLISAVEAAMTKDCTIREQKAEEAQVQSRYGRLTARERQVMSEVVKGRLNKQIANDLGIVEKTTKVHRARVMQKMEVRSVAALVHQAERFHLEDGHERTS